jgi:2-keto-4-pentenoate hydratase/2-oxohepta-3-ene-1,7-dioic acid hydratase in catechol pathway
LRIARYVHDGKEHYGALHNQVVVTLPLLAERLGAKLPPKLEGLIKAGNSCLETAENVIARAGNADLEACSCDLDRVSLMAPVEFPPKILLLGLNYVDHVSETNKKAPEEPIIFMKPHTTIIGPGQNIIKPSFVTQLDYEGELAVVIGEKVKNVSVAEAQSCIFGYTILNDVSARNFQFKDGQWTRGKSFDTFAPIGPWITTKTQLPDTSNLRIRTWVNSELRQNATTRRMSFNVAEIIHHISRVMTLEPCDIIATGTPSGVGFAMKPPKFLQDGDVVRIEIEGIGTLENKVLEKKT